MPTFVNNLRKDRYGLIAWDGYAHAEVELVDGELFTFMVSQDEAGVAVGVRSIYGSDYGPGYADMLLSIVVTTKKYSVYAGSTLVTGPTAYDPTKPFAIGYAGGNLIAFVDGVAKHHVPCSEHVIPVASIFSPWDHVYDAEPSAALIDTAAAGGFDTTSSLTVIPQFKMLGVSALGSSSGFGATFIRTTNFVIAFALGDTTVSEASFDGKITPTFPDRGVAAHQTASDFAALAQTLVTGEGDAAMPSLLAIGGNVQFEGGGDVVALPAIGSAAYGGVLTPTYALHYVDLGGLQASGTMVPFGTTTPFGEDGGSYPIAPPSHPAILTDPYGFAQWQAGLLSKLPGLAALGWDHAPDSYGYSVLPAIESAAADGLPTTMSLNVTVFPFTLQAKMRTTQPGALNGLVPRVSLAAQTGHRAALRVPARTLATQVTVTGMMRLNKAIGYA